ncbi:MAG: hypothetical protein HND44_07775 [Chloroflexi bacterium]|nr:hypothetical protein [Ardenticatenaceae bacterium]MBL1128386.1 hypothetical protein [Chloroflexota bacterium]NOG34462.1 hypothetical protein [Chloroflexota bacterium]GIK59032.1 MAG: hypothetical protein BroJett015_46950 [Chloroflexota bacterium]
MKKHRLLLYEFSSRRVRGKLLLLWLLLLALALYDRFITEVLGDFWFVVWLMIPVLVALWVYYAYLVRRAALIVTPQYVLLQGPLTAVKISYGRIASITSTHMAQHHDPQSLKMGDHFRVDPLYEYTCGFIEFISVPPGLKKNRRHFSRFLFSPQRPGLLLVVDDWMKLSRDLEVARQKWQEAHGIGKKEDTRSLAARILDYGKQQ